jgi:Protein of unknown function (DUF1236)
MTKYMSEQEERRGTRRVMLGAVAVAVLACIGVLVWVWLPSFRHSPRLTNATGVRTDQPQGTSLAGKNSKPPRLAARNVVNPPYIGRAHQIESTATSKLDLKPQQVKAIRSYADQERQQRLDTVNFPIAVGAAVPTSLKLHNMPPKLSDVLHAYRNDQYFLVPRQFIIVEKKTRRIVAIVPA